MTIMTDDKRDIPDHEVISQAKAEGPGHQIVKDFFERSPNLNQSEKSTAQTPAKGKLISVLKLFKKYNRPQENYASTGHF